MPDHITELIHDIDQRLETEVRALLKVAMQRHTSASKNRALEVESALFGVARSCEAISQDIRRKLA